MSSFAIRAYHLGKHYTISHNHQQVYRYKTLQESLVGVVRRAVERRSAKTQPDVEQFLALEDVSFEVRQGEVLGIIGPNGAGKSTLLKIISRITEPTVGYVDVVGRVGSLLEVGTGFHPELTGRENVFLNGTILGMTRREIGRQFDQIVDFAGVEMFLDTPVKRYSSGMWVRLAFAVAAHLEPEILIVDEVLAVGDTAFQQKCLSKIGDVSRDGRTVLLVSHNMNSIASLCSTAIWLNKGRLIRQDTPKDVIAAYLSGGAKENGEIAWPDIRHAPGNEHVRLKAVRVMCEGETTAQVLVSKPIEIQAEYWNLQDENILVAGLALKDKMGNYVLASNNRASANLVVDNWYERPRPKGLFVTSCTIPANFLNSENYTLDFGIANQRNQWDAYVENVISFTVLETGEMTKEYGGHWVGVVRPRLPWFSEYLMPVAESDCA